MPGSAIAPTSPRSTGLRLFLAFLIGLLLGPNPFLPGWSQWAVPVGVLTVALLLSIVLDSGVRYSGIPTERMIIDLLPMLLTAGIILMTVGVLLGQFRHPLLIFVILAVFPFFVGLLGTFIVGSNGTWTLALGTGLAAWLGSGLLFSIPGYIHFPLFWVIPCFGIAALGGLAGRALRLWSLEKPLHLPAMASTSARPVLIPLLLAFALGLPTTLWFPFVRLPTPVWWRWEVPVGVLVVAMLLSILLAPGVRHGAISPGRTLLSLVVVLLFAGVMIAVGVLNTALQGTGAFLGIVVLALIPFSVGLAVAFAVGSSGTWRLALGSALLGWLGAAIVNVIASILDFIAYRSGGDEDITLAFTLVAVVIAFGIAAPGGILGRRLRIWLLKGI